LEKMGLGSHARLSSALLQGRNPSGLNALEHEEQQRSRLKRLIIVRNCKYETGSRKPEYSIGAS
jgi:hypothetical protein